MNGACNGTISLGPAPWGHEIINGTIFWSLSPEALGRGQQVNYYLISIKNQFQRFLNQTLCVFSQIKDIKHTSRDFHSVAWVWDLGVQGGQKFYFLNMVMLHIKFTGPISRPGYTKNFSSINW